MEYFVILLATSTLIFEYDYLILFAKDMVTNNVPARRVGAALAATEGLQIAAKAAPTAIAFILDSSQIGKLFLAKS